LGTRHRLDEMVIIAILAVICGADSWVAVAQFGRAKLKWLKTFLELPHGIPSHDRFGGVFAAIQPERFERCFMAWMRALARVAGRGLIAIDGKTLRQSLDRAGGQAAIHMVSAWSAANGLVFGQIATEAKSNEITAIPKLLGLLDIEGCVATIDAMGCQKEIAAKVVENKGDYVLSLKGNQGTMHDEVSWWLNQAIAGTIRDVTLDHYRQVNKGHGRIETREIWCAHQVDWFADRGQWAGLASLIAVDSQRRLADGTVQKERRYFISSLTDATAKTFARLIRGHWQIENNLHWSLDLSFGEDACRVRKGYGAENFSRLRRIALNLLRNESSVKAGIRIKRLRAGWDEDYLLKILTG
jgi:predicted transposase YbfD/YdcC